MRSQAAKSIRGYAWYAAPEQGGVQTVTTELFAKTNAQWPIGSPTTTAHRQGDRTVTSSGQTGYLVVTTSPMPPQTEGWRIAPALVEHATAVPEIEDVRVVNAHTTEWGHLKECEFMVTVQSPEVPRDLSLPTAFVAEHELVPAHLRTFEEVYDVWD